MGNSRYPGSLRVWCKKCQRFFGRKVGSDFTCNFCGEVLTLNQPKILAENQNKKAKEQLREMGLI